MATQTVSGGHDDPVLDKKLNVSARKFSVLFSSVRNVAFSPVILTTNFFRCTTLRRMLVISIRKSFVISTLGSNETINKNNDLPFEIPLVRGSAASSAPPARLF